MARDFRKFYTPHNVALLLVKLAEVSVLDNVLEPHAGNGALVKAVRALVGNSVKVDAVESNAQERDELWKVANRVYVQDFLEFAPPCRYSVVLANPPFGNETDVHKHLARMLCALAPGGRFVALLPQSVSLPNTRRIALENWSSNADGTTTPIHAVVWTA